MSRHLSVLSNLVIVLQVFLLLFCFVDLGAVPPIILFAGKFHPVILHLPITLILLLIPVSFIVQKKSDTNDVSKLFELMLYYVALVSTITAIAGFFLAASGGYEPEALKFHKWLGVAVAFSTHALVYLKKLVITNFKIWNVALTSTFIIMLVGSHFGGTLTHGEGFFAFKEENKSGVVIPEFTEKTTVFAGAIQPILEAKCVTCHNDKKAKGGLNMKNIALMLKGGKNGAMWVSGDPDKSLMIERMLLDMDDKNHMPPKGKFQLSSTEILLFQEWIRSGANEKKTFHSLASTDTLKKVIAKLIESLPSKTVVKTYDFQAASEATISKLNSPFRRVIPISANSPALAVKFFLKEKFDIKLLQECKEISTQIVELSLAGMPVDDQVFTLISTFTNLEKLNLNTTSITGSKLKDLVACKKLEQLSLTSTSVGVNEISSIIKMPSLKRIFVWNTKISDADITTLKGKSSQINWEMGYVPNKAELLKLSVPFPADKEKMILDKEESITLKNPLPGAKIRYTTDGTVPDSINGTIYTSPIPAKDLLRIKAITTADGWITSDVSDFTFYQKGLSCDSAKLLNVPSRTGPAGALMLIDNKKGLSQTADQLYSNWIGFLDNPFKAGFYFKNNPELKQIVLSTADMTSSYVFPPTKITIKAGSDSKNLKVIGTLSPEMPTDNRPNSSIPYIVPIKPGNYTYVEIEIQNLKSLPPWHQGKGQKAWVFVDEVFFY